MFSFKHLSPVYTVYVQSHLYTCTYEEESEPTVITVSLSLNVEEFNLFVMLLFNCFLLLGKVVKHFMLNVVLATCTLILL